MPAYFGGQDAPRNAAERAAPGGTATCRLKSRTRIHVPKRRVCKVAFTSTPRTKTCPWGPRRGKSHSEGVPLGTAILVLL